MDPSDAISADNPLVLELVEEEVAAYRGLLPPEAVEELRKALVLAMVTHPYPKELLEQLKKSPVVHKSGPRAAGDPVEQEGSTPVSAKASSKGRRPR